jgi:hypothetical protein
MNVTKEQFERYESVRKSGVTNMNLINAVCDLTELQRDMVLYIMKHYGELYDRYIGGKNESESERVLEGR